MLIWCAIQYWIGWYFAFYAHFVIGWNVFINTENTVVYVWSTSGWLPDFRKWILVDYFATCLPCLLYLGTTLQIFFNDLKWQLEFKIQCVRTYNWFSLRIVSQCSYCEALLNTLKKQTLYSSWGEMRYCLALVLDVSVSFLDFHIQ